MAPDCRKTHLRASILPKFPGGACPHTPVAGAPGNPRPKILDPPLQDEAFFVNFIPFRSKLARLICEVTQTRCNRQTDTHNKSTKSANPWHYILDIAKANASSLSVCVCVCHSFYVISSPCVLNCKFPHSWYKDGTKLNTKLSLP